MQQIDMMGLGKIGGQPRQQQIESVVVGGEAQHESPHPALAQQVSQGRSLGGSNTIFGLRSAAHDELALGIGESFVFTGIAIESVEQREIKNADHPRRRKIPAPSKM